MRSVYADIAHCSICREKNDQLRQEQADAQRREVMARATATEAAGAAQRAQREHEGAERAARRREFSALPIGGRRRKILRGGATAVGVAILLAIVLAVCAVGLTIVLTVLIPVIEFLFY